VATDGDDSEIPDCQLNVYNFKTLRDSPAARYGALRFDSNNTCNLHCVYCHNHRSDQTIDADEFRSFLESRIRGVTQFQVGCIMEPTLDPRLADLMLMIGNSPARPTECLILQTNGLLIHRHDHAKLQAAGLTRLSVSLDTADPQMQKSLRSGMSLDKVLRNITEFMRSCPGIEVEFISVVTAINIDQIEMLIDLGLDRGVRRFVLRELLYYPNNDVVDHVRMPGLLLRAGQFAEMIARVQARFGDKIELYFASNDQLDASAREMFENSRFIDRNSIPARFGAKELT
jgi:molybdenum cofactor biosynthesis enzyme MoaA